MTQSKGHSGPVHLASTIPNKTKCGFVCAKLVSEVRGKVTCKRCIRWIGANMSTGGLRR